jgi:CheY-like chemotaxis protein
MSQKINVVVVDDDKEIRDMLMNMVEDWVDNNDLGSDFEIDFREYTNGKDMVADIEDLRKNGWIPQLCCVDYRMDCGNGSYVIKKINEMYPNKEFNVLMITAWSNSCDLDFVKKDCIVVDKVDPEAIETAIQLELESVVQTNLV